MDELQSADEFAQQIEGLDAEALRAIAVQTYETLAQAVRTGERFADLLALASQSSNTVIGQFMEREKEIRILVGDLDEYHAKRFLDVLDKEDS